MCAALARAGNAADRDGRAHAARPGGEAFGPRDRRPLRRPGPRYVLTEAGRHAFPSPAEVPALMGDFAAWLGDAPDTPETAFAAHRRLVDIHPFNDGNGRTARLLMNLVLLRGGYPPVAVRPEDRPAYVRALQEAGAASFDRLLYERLDATLDEYLNALREALAAPGIPIAQRDEPTS